MNYKAEVSLDINFQYDALRPDLMSGMLNYPYANKIALLAKSGTKQTDVVLLIYK